MRFHSIRLLIALVLLPATVGLPMAHAAPPSKELQQQLIHAVVQDQIPVVPVLLKQGGDPNARVAPGKEDAWALENSGDDDPSPPLIVIACRFGSIHGPQVIQLLLEHGADVNIEDRNGVRPLMVASELGVSNSLLLEHGARVNVKDHNGKTPVMYAMNNRGLATAAELLKHGAHINASDKSGWTPLMYAIRQAGHDPIMLYGEDLTEKATEEKTRYVELVRFLVESGANVNARDKAGTTALKSAIFLNQPEIEQLLRKAGAKE